MKKIEFYFDPVSPFVYLSWFKLHEEISPRDDIEIEYVPIFLGAVLKHHEITGPVFIKAKREYNRKDMLRWAKLYGLEMKIPQKMPFNSLYILKFFIAIEDKDKQKKFMDQVEKAIWVEQQDGSNSSLIKQAAAEIGLDADELGKKAVSAEIKNQLKMNNERAIEKGIFGVPSFTVGDEMFWGNDRLDFVFRALH